VTAITPTVASSRTANIDFITVSLATLLLAVQLVSLATFNHQPDKVRLLVDGLSLVGYGVLVVLALGYARPATMLHLVGLILFCGAGFIGLALYPETTSPSHFIEHVTSPMLLGLLTMRRAPAPGRITLWLLWFTCAGAGVLASAFAFLGPHQVLGGVTRLAVFAGGQGGIHPSAYASACFFLALFVLWRAKVGFSLVTMTVLALLAVVIFKYQVRTVWVMLMVFAGFSLFYWLAKRSMNLLIAAIGLGLLGAVAIVFLLVSTGFDLGHFSSGRTLIYVERLRVISSRDLLEFLFGSGSGTDKMRGVSAWRWAEKDSHNDFLIVTIELGLVGLLGFLAMIIAPIAALAPPRKGWIVMMAASSAVSNGVLLRPSIGAPLILIAWLSVALREQALQQAEQEQAWLNLDPVPPPSPYPDLVPGRPSRAAIASNLASGAS